MQVRACTHPNIAVFDLCREAGENTETIKSNLLLGAEHGDNCTAFPWALENGRLGSTWHLLLASIGYDEI